jgi:dynein heavy chain
MDAYRVAMAKKKDLETQVSTCEQQSDRAKKLLNGLSGEKERWIESSFALDASNNAIVGDVLLSSAIVAYFGAFTGHYRQQCLNKCISILRANKLPFSSDFTLAKTFSEPVIIRGWLLAGIIFSTTVVY